FASEGEATVEEFLQGAAADAFVESIASDLSPGLRFTVLQKTGRSVEETCTRIRQTLMDNHLLFYPTVAHCPVRDALLRNDPTAPRILREGFFKVVVLDAQEGLDPEGVFRLPGFYTYTCDRPMQTYQLGASRTYHEEDIAQILRDEARSLICLVNVHLVPRR